MENFDQIKIDIFDKIQKANNRNSLDSVKTEIFGRGKVVKQIPNAGLETKNVKTIKLFLM